MRVRSRPNLRGLEESGSFELDDHMKEKEPTIVWKRRIKTCLKKGKICDHSKKEKKHEMPRKFPQEGGAIIYLEVCKETSKYHTIAQNRAMLVCYSTKKNKCGPKKQNHVIVHQEKSTQSRTRVWLHKKRFQKDTYTTT